MESLILVVVICWIVGVVVWNHRQQAVAAAGVSFIVARPPGDVARIVESLYCVGVKAKTRSALTRIHVRSIGQGVFEMSTRIGDRGEIRVVGDDTGGRSRVTTEITQLHIGAHPMTVSNRASMWGFSTRLANAFRIVLRLSTYAGRLNRFQKGLERKVVRQATMGAAVAG